MEKKKKKKSFGLAPDFLKFRQVVGRWKWQKSNIFWSRAHQNRKFASTLHHVNGSGARAHEPKSFKNINQKGDDFRIHPDKENKEPSHTKEGGGNVGQNVALCAEISPYLHHVLDHVPMWCRFWLFLLSVKEFEWQAERNLWLLLEKPSLSSPWILCRHPQWRVKKK